MNRSTITASAATTVAVAAMATGVVMMTNGPGSHQAASAPTSSASAPGSHQTASAPKPSSAQTDAATTMLQRASAAKNADAPALSTVDTKVRVNPDDTNRADLSQAYKGTASLKTTASVSASSQGYNSTPAHRPSSTMKPNRISIPSIGLYASVIPEKVDSNNYLTIPQQSWRTAWDATTAPLNATYGNTVIAGHVSLNGVPGVFYTLSKVHTSALIYISDSTGKVHAFRVVTSNLYGKTALPNSVFYPAVPRALTLITCGGKQGVVNGPQGQEYAHLDNLAVQAVPVAMS